MGQKTSISWTDATWNPIRGCSRISTGCEHCYAEGVAGRFSGPRQPYEGLARRTRQGFRWTGEVRLIEQALPLPRRWKRPRRIFVNSMSDLFHERIPDAWIDQIFEIMLEAPHTFQILTKRPERMQQYVTQWLAPALLPQILGHIWLGVSIENQATADARIPWLLQTPAMTRFISYEPALGPVDFTRVRYPGIAWPVDVLRRGAWDVPGWIPGFTNHSDMAGIDQVIVGGESGPDARPCDIGWLRSTVTQCKDAGVACFVKQYGAKPYYVSEYDKTYSVHLKDKKGADPTEWDAELQVQQFPQTNPFFAL